ncbi:MAG: hypothetical protein VXY90_13910, partial [Pseudomonadota bacterium]|nr:hypothetical protein [Pseudomonadota bacterium]
MQRLGVGIAAALSIAFRQTNAVWVAFAVASSALRQLHAERRLDLHAGLRQTLLTDLPSLLPADSSARINLLSAPFTGSAPAKRADAASLSQWLDRELNQLRADPSLSEG